MEPIIIDEDYIQLSDGTIITFDHEQDCCEYNYADFEALRGTTFEDMVITKDNLRFEVVEDCGFRINEHFVPCYSSQNGYYTDELDIYVNGTKVFSLECQLDT